MKKNFKFVIILVVIALGLGLYLILNKKEADNVRFSKEYASVTEDNVFTYRSIDEIIRIMEKGTGVVYLGFPECPWCNAYVKYLNEVAKEAGIDKIYYYNIFTDRLNNTEEYQKIVKLLTGNLQYDQEGNERIFVPNVSFHIKGKLIGNDYETSLDTKGLSNPTEYWTEEEVNDLKNTLTKYMQQVYVALNACTDCNK